MSTSSNLLASSVAPPHGRRRAAASFVFALVFSLALLADSPRARAQDTPAEAQPTPPQSAPATSATNTTNTPADKPAKGAAGTITGRVLADGEPAAGVRVFAITPSSNRSNVEPLATTDEGGNFRIENLAPGLYTVGTGQRVYVVDPDSYPAGRPPIYRPGDDVTIRLVKGGVVTGTVTNADGEPIVAIAVRALYARDLEGGTINAGVSFGEDQTDDRGVYRIYGLRAGVYVVATAADGARSNWPGAAAPHRSEAPTYYPSGTRDTASEVTVRAGQETAGIDIRHRGERGRRVTGVVIAAQGAADSVAFVTLTHTATGTQVGTVFTQPGANERPFSFEAVADGEYEVQARVSAGGLPQSSSAAQRAVVAGGDLTGLRLALTPLATISGSLIIEPSSEADRAKGVCKEQPRATPLLPQETAVVALGDDTSKKNPAARRLTARRDTAPDSSGGFALRALEPGRYRFDLRLADDNWYFRELHLPTTTTTATAATATPTAARPGAARRPSTTPAATSAANTAATRDTLELNAGQQVAGLVVRVAENAASLSGRVAPREENAPLPPSSQLRVHLIPAAREQADNALRYAETTPAPDGSYSFKNLAPGRYLVLVRGAEAGDAARPAAWDSASRARLRREAEEANVAVELQPCQRTNDFALRFPPSPGK